jgi:hypothetical protein
MEELKMTDKIKITNLTKVHEIDVRKNTNKLLEMIDEQLIDPKDVVLMCVKWMSESEVTEMMRVNELFEGEDEEEDEEEEDDRSELPWDYGKHFD